MHSKKNNNNKSQNFIQGLRPFSSSIPHGLKKILKKNGYNFSNIVDNWTKMVGKNISDSCYPITIKMSKDRVNGTLLLNVIHGKEVEIEYAKQEIMDKINSFFGYNFLNEIKLKVIQKEKIKDEIMNTRIVNSKIKEKLETIQNLKLKSSLDQLIEAFKRKND